MRPAGLLVGLALGYAPGIVWSQPGNTTVSELTVVAPIKCATAPTLPERSWGTRPKVVSAFPEPGATVRPGLVILRLTFDQPMACEVGFAPAAGGKLPRMPETPIVLLSSDRKTIRTVVQVEPATSYGAMTGPDTAFGPFKSLSGTPAETHTFRFTTSAGPRANTTCEALIQDPVSAEALAGRGRESCAQREPE